MVNTGMPTIEERLGQWQQELLDLSNRNRLLNFRPSTTRPTSIQLLSPQPAELFRTLLQGASLRIVGHDPEVEGDKETELGSDEQDDAGSSTEQRVVRTAREVTDALDQPLPSSRRGTVLSNLVVEKNSKVASRLLANARASEQEQGVNILFAAFGFLKWKERPGEVTWRQSPLVLLPVKIEEQVREGGFKISSTGDDPEFNQTLGERLRRDFGMDLSVEVHEETPLSDVFNDVRSAVASQEEWSVLDHAHLGTFQFHKLRMFTDLSEHAAVAVGHDIVQALALDGVGIAPLPDSLPGDEDLDRVVTPDRSFSVLDADASQLRAVQAAVRGSHLIVEGPPGTGKSQTIANIIAETIAAGKTVMFVSEKAAAIEVVHRRLAERGLGDLCLMLHSHKANKRDVIYDLGSQLQTVSTAPASAREELASQRLQATRSQLNTYAEALHRTREPLGESIYWAHGRLAKLRDAPYLSVAAPSDELTHERLAMWSRVLEQTGRHAEVLREGEAHPWHGVRHEHLTIGEQEALRHTLRLTGAALAQVQEVGDTLAETLGLPMPGSTQEARTLVTVAASIPDDGRFDAAWFVEEQSEDRATLVQEAAARAVDARAALAKLLDVYEEAILETDVERVLASYRQGSLTRRFSSSYRQHRSTVRDLAKDRRQRDPSDEILVLEAVQKINEDNVWWEEHRSRLLSMLGASSGRADLRDPGGWERIDRDLAAARRLVGLLDGQPPTSFTVAVSEPNPGRKVRPAQNELDAALDQLQRQVETLRAAFTTSSRDYALLSDPDERFEDLSRWTGVHTVRFAALDSLLSARRARRDVEGSGLTSVVDELLSEGVASERWTEALHRLLLRQWLDHGYKEDEALSGFRGVDHEAVAREFRSLDHQHLRTSVQRIRRSLGTERVKVNTGYGGEPELVRRESEKRKRHMPLRKLFERIPKLLPILKPCLMMSPLSVAQFLPADRYRFDLVIFDEASQVKPHDAIGAIMRGRQVVVAGDRKQLPPTAFFDRSTDDGAVDDGAVDEDQQDIRALESILDALRAKDMPSTQLVWHYRSRHEDLIAFSNRNFYESRLITFPSANADRSPTRGVRLEYVPDAVYEDERDAVDLTTRVRVNRIEARRVVAIVMQHAKTRPDETLGVVALNLRQKETIEEELKRARLVDRSADDFFDGDSTDNFFVKALEQVQGDERDLIIVSVGYGKNRDGVLSHNFGPINQDGGERRLNVLVTRARHQIIVVSSIRAADIDPTRISKRGPLLLKSYLDFAERGPVALDAQTSGGDGDYESPFEEQVGVALSRAGLTVHRQVGTSRFRIDLAIVHPDQPGRYLLGIECDGKTYHQSKTARDRDRLRQEILEGLGWTIHRIWSTDWIRQPEQELVKVVARVAHLLAEPAPYSTSEGVGSSDGETRDEVEESGDWSAPTTLEDQAHLNGGSGSDPLVLPYTVADVRPEYGGYGNILSLGSHLVADVVADCVEVEGPIHVDLLLRRIAAGYGHQRAGSRISGRISEAVQIATQQGRVQQRGQFLWSSEERPLEPRGPAPDGSTREVGHISEEEIRRAMAVLLEQSFSLSSDELIGRTSRLFGFQRTGSDIRHRLASVVETSVNEGALVRLEDRYQLPRDAG